MFSVRSSAAMAFCVLVLVSTSAASAATVVQPPVTVYSRTAGNFVYSIGTDVDGDGRADVFSWSDNDSTEQGVTLVKATQVGSGVKRFIDLNGVPSGTALAAGDLDGDGDADLVASVFYNTGDGQPRLVSLFQDQFGNFGHASEFWTYGDAPQSLRLVDVNEDGRLDAIGASGLSGVVVFPNMVAGLHWNATVSPMASSGDMAAVSDLDGDGHLDVLMKHYPCCTGGSPAGVMLGDGTGQFAAEVMFPSVALIPQSFAAGDLDGDGDTDLVVLFQGGGITAGTIATYRNDGGTFTALPSVNTVVVLVSIAIGDMDGDGRPDVLGVGSGNVITTFNGTDLAGPAPFAVGVDYEAGTHGRFISTADIDGDGFEDALVGGSAEAKAVVTSPMNMNSGGGPFDPLLLLSLLVLGGWMALRARRRASAQRLS